MIRNPNSKIQKNAKEPQGAHILQKVEKWAKNTLQHKKNKI